MTLFSLYAFPFLFQKKSRRHTIFYGLHRISQTKQIDINTKNRDSSCNSSYCPIRDVVYFIGGHFANGLKHVVHPNNFSMTSLFYVRVGLGKTQTLFQTVTPSGPRVVVYLALDLYGFKVLFKFPKLTYLAD